MSDFTDFQNKLIFKIKMKQKTIRYYIHKFNEGPFREEKIYKIIIITIAESIENTYHVTRQKLHFVHTP